MKARIIENIAGRNFLVAYGPIRMLTPREPRGERRLSFVPGDENIGFRNYRFSIFSRPDISSHERVPEYD
jgi:hypothetical protein